MKKLVISAGVVFAALILTASIVSLVSQTVPDYSNNNTAILSVQALNTIIVYGLASIAGIRLTVKETPVDFMRLDRKIRWNHLLPAVLFPAIAFPAVNMLADLNTSLHFPDFLSDIETAMRNQETLSHELTARLTEVGSIPLLSVNIIVMAVLPAICEEMMFRGWLQTSIVPLVGKHTAVWTSAFIFSAIHMQFFAFIPRFLSGVALGYIFLYSGSLWGAVIAHFINNLIVIVITFARYNNLISFEIENLGTGTTIYVGIISLAVSIMIVTLMAKGRKISLPDNSFSEQQ